jgi:hypothetical protein
MILLAVWGRPASATAVVVTPLDRPVDLNTSPSVRLVAHGVQSPLTYRFTVEIQHEFTSRTLHLAPGAESLRQYTDFETGKRVFEENPGPESTMWVIYDGKRNERFPLRRMKIAYTQPIGGTETDVNAVFRYRERVPLPPGQMTAVDLDFDLPRAGDVPRRVELRMDDVELGEGITFDGRAVDPIVGRGPLRYLNQVLGAWYAENQPGESEQARE